MSSLGSLYILDASPWSDICFTNIFSPSIAWFFSPSYWCLQRTKLLILISLIYLFFFLFWLVFLCSVSEILVYPKAMHSLFLTRSFSVLAFTSTSVICLGLTFLCDDLREWWMFIFVHMDSYLFQHCWNSPHWTSLPTLFSFIVLYIDHYTNSIPSWFLNFLNKNYKITVWVLQTLSFFKLVLATLCPSHFHIKFRISLSISNKKKN